MTACSAPTIHGFKLTVSGPLTLTPGSTGFLAVDATATSSSPVTAALIFYSVPAGVTYTPASPTVTTGNQTVIAFTAAPNAAPTPVSQVQVTGYVGLASSTAYVNIGVVANP